MGRGLGALLTDQETVQESTNQPIAEKLNAVKESLAGEGHLVYPMDLLKVDTIPNAVEEVLAKVGAIDILVNNAGISQRSLAKDTLMEVDRKIMELDYFAAISLTKSALPHMIEILLTKGS